MKGLRVMVGNAYVENVDFDEAYIEITCSTSRAKSWGVHAIASVVTYVKHVFGPGVIVTTVEDES